MIKELWLTFTLLICGSQYARTQSTCGGFTSANNPYPCCQAGGNPNGGNCTWWAWKEANDFWGRPLSWSGGPPKMWIHGAQSKGFIVNPIPAALTIAVNLTAYDKTLGLTNGHVAWVLSVSNDGSSVLVSEMVCGANGMDTKWYPTSYFTNGGGGFIYPQTYAPTAVLASSIPLFIKHSPQSQLIEITGSNFDSTNFLYVTSPDKSSIILKGLGSLPLATPNRLEANLTFGISGRWQIVAVGSNGASSNTLYLNIE